MASSPSSSSRLLSLDILRGITVAGMIVVNNGWEGYFPTLTHSRWNGLTLCDLVFPFFLFIMGISTCLSLSKSQFRPTRPLVLKILRRTLLLFLIGLAINWLCGAVEGDFGFSHLRIWGIMQRIALCYCLASLFVLFLPHKYLPSAIAALLLFHTVLLLAGNGYAYDETNILARADRTLFGWDHLYHKSPVDPEGLLATPVSVAHVLIGFCCGKLLKQTGNLDTKVMNILLLGTVLLLLGWFLTQCGMPLNKRVWSPSYLLVTCGAAALLQGLLMFVIDIRGHRRWTRFFHVFGANALFLYVVSELLNIFLAPLGVSAWIYEAVHALISSQPWASLGYSLVFLLLCFLCGYPLYRRKIYIKL